LLFEDVTILKGVGEKTAEDLRAMNIHTIEDLLFYFPYRHEIHEVKSLNELVHDTEVTLVGTIEIAPHVRYGRTRLTLFTMNVEGANVRVVLFFPLFQKEKYKKGTTVTVRGKWDAHRLQITANKLSLGRPKKSVEIESVYSVKGNLTSGRLRSFIRQALNKYGNLIEEILPLNYLQKYKLPDRKEALKTMHKPKSSYELKHARRRFIYEELLLYQLKMQLYKETRKEKRIGPSIAIEKDLVEQFKATLPYTLTNSQQRSLDEIIADLKGKKQMYRLLQGDVGSGKTAVATISLYAVAKAGYQGAFMVPTEILAEQHYETVKEMLGNKVKVALLTSSIKGKKRDNILTNLKNNEIDIIIGTHSLIQEEVHFANLGFVIIDEQHRFGVDQRRLLLEKGEAPNVLHMTATPIPRTLAITAFGDLDISTIDELPKGRKQVETYVIREHLLDRLLNFIEQRVKEGEQVYFISPLIEESEAFDYENAIDLYHKLEAHYPSSIHIGLLHGRMKNEEKEEVMKQFVHREIDILVSTTVIEVGVNVPNATVMVIYDAERFGLAQLHQLRGRVGRGEKQSYCILIADPKSDDGKERMRIIAETNDGFKLAEADLKLRGPGDFFGKKQSGLPEFKVADPIEHFRALEVARTDALDIVQNKKWKADPDYQPLYRYVEQLDIVQFD